MVPKWQKNKQKNEKSGNKWGKNKQKTEKKTLVCKNETLENYNFPKYFFHYSIKTIFVKMTRCKVFYSG